MSAGYGKYLIEEDLNKKKQEGTTPSTTPTTAAGGTTTPPLTYEGFVGTGSGSQAYQTNVGYVNNQYNASVNAANTNKEMGTQYAQAQKDSIYGAANTNKELGMSYAEGVKNSIYGNAAAQRAEADKNTEVARQRGIIDSQSSYQKAIGAYGSNAETLAGRGLSGSGYGEYLTADAYATHRGQVQNINADALRANREAAYAENQAKMAADSEYLKNLYGINTEYNKAVSGADSEYLKNLYGINTEYNAAMNKAESDRTTGMYQAALGLNEAQNTAYGKLFDSASKGVSIDAIMQDGTWGDLTSEQQQAITAEAKRFANNKSVNEFKGLIDGGTSLENIQNSEAWSKLTPAQKTDVTNYYNNKQSGDALETDSNYLGLLSDINSGALTIGAIKNTAIWNTLSGPQQAQLEAAATLRGKTETKDRMGVYADLATKGVSLEDIKTMMEINGDKYVEELSEEEYNALTDEQKAEYNEARNFMKLIESGVKTYADQQTAQQNDANYNTALGLLADGWTIDEIKNHLGVDAVKALTDSGKFAQIENASNVMKRIKSETEGKEASQTLSSYLKLAKEGWDIDSIIAIAKSMGHYDTLTKKGTDGTALWDAVTSEADAYTQENHTTEENEAFIASVNNVLESGGGLDELKNIEGFDAWTGVERDEAIRKASDNTINSMVTRGSSLDEIKNSEAWATASTAVKDQVEAYYKEQAEIDRATIDAAVAEFTSVDEDGKLIYGSLDALNRELDLYIGEDGKGLSPAVKEEIRNRWAAANVDNDLEAIGGATIENGKMVIDGEQITADWIVENIKAGLYGDRVDEVVEKFAKAWVDKAKAEGATAKDIIGALHELHALGKKGEYYYGKVKGAFKVRADATISVEGGNYRIYGIDFKPSQLEDKVSDKDLIAAFDEAAPPEEGKAYLLRVGDEYYYTNGNKGTGRVWYKMTKATGTETSTETTPETSQGSNLSDKDTATKAYLAGDISAQDYVAKCTTHNEATEGETKKWWITSIKNKTRPGESITVEMDEYSAKVTLGSAISGDLYFALNEVATGNKQKSPGIATSAATNSMVVYKGKLYIYAGYGWCEASSIKGDYYEIVAAFLANPKRDTVFSTGTQR